MSKNDEIVRIFQSPFSEGIKRRLLLMAQDFSNSPSPGARGDVCRKLKGLTLEDIDSANTKYILDEAMARLDDLDRLKDEYNQYKCLTEVILERSRRK